MKSVKRFSRILQPSPQGTGILPLMENSGFSLGICCKNSPQISRHFWNLLQISASIWVIEICFKILWNLQSASDTKLLPQLEICSQTTLGSAICCRYQAHVLSWYLVQTAQKSAIWYRYQVPERFWDLVLKRFEICYLRKLLLASGICSDGLGSARKRLAPIVIRWRGDLT